MRTLYRKNDEKQRLVSQRRVSEDSVAKSSRQSHAIWEHLLFFLLLIPTVLSILLVLSDVRNWHMPPGLYALVDEYRTSIQTAVQIVATILSTIQLFALCRLINWATRILFGKHPTSLNVLGLWSAMSTPSINWTLPLWMIALSIVMVNLSAVISALWTGALTPAKSVAFNSTTLMVPDWSNTTLIKEYPSEIDQTGPTIRNTKGYFTYSVGVGLLTPLVASASTATTVDGSIRNHNKLDNSGYTYHGRSYGAGASVGLVDDILHRENPRATNYTYEETGLAADVACIYNRTSQFTIQELGNVLHALRGPLPDSNLSAPEYSVYIGRGNRTIVGIGVSGQPAAFTAKRALQRLRRHPSRNITVARLDGAATSIDPTHRIAHVVTRQLELISNDLTSFYRSTLGDALNASISDYRTAVAVTSPNISLSEEQIVLTGLENAIVSFVDDMLVAYASAQLVVGGFATPASAAVHVSALRLGSRVYIVATAAITGVIVLLVIAEMVRTKGWRGLPAFDYLDNRMLVLGASAGGGEIAEYAAERRWKATGKIPVVLRTEADHQVIALGVVRGSDRQASESTLAEETVQSTAFSETRQVGGRRVAEAGWI
ncbi:hypothetical protein IFM60648_09212 [Aspergillus lentulus]|uniref:Uncharacterized protein n=1 Tax=Aspergillus lentulus TaxID=293939 RepID=A0ABQ1AZD0_ASPLE|nr:hypothetical protein IFM60648_09212 [Aspergillus lentulus]